MGSTKDKLVKKDRELEKQYNINKTNKSINENILITHRAQLREKQLEIDCLKGTIAELKIGEKITKEKAAKLDKNPHEKAGEGTEGVRSSGNGS